MNRGSWDVIGRSGAVCIHTFQLPDNRLVCVERPHELPYPQNPNTNGNVATEISLKDNAGNFQSSFQTVPMESNAFCGGHAMLGDGSILFVGGDARNDTGLKDGRKTIRQYNPCLPGKCTDTKGGFTELYQMSTERWYPTIVTLGDGNAIIISGSKDSLELDKIDAPIQNPTYEYYPPKSGEWPKNLEILTWAWPFVLYPMAFQLPSGNVFLFVSNKTVIINPKTDEIYNDLVSDLLLAPNHYPFIYPYSPTMVMLPLTKENNYKATLLLCGGSERDLNNGGNPISSNKCFKVSPDGTSPAKWEREDNMPIARVMPDSVLLPDGKILFVNGAGYGLAGGAGGEAGNAGNPIFQASLYDPKASAGKRWSALAAATVPRLYHSGAILTPDGYVITTGSEMSNYVDYAGPNADPNCQGRTRACTDPYEYRIERYTPYYLTNGKERPVIVTCPAELTYNSSFYLEIPKGTKVTNVTFIRYATTTHSTNTDQRFVELDILGGNETHLGVRAPINGDLAPPGNWMLFILREGTPSVAKVVNLQSGPQTNVDLSYLNVKSSSSRLTYPMLIAMLTIAYLLI